MLVSHQKEFIYTKTYKTASTSIELFFEPYCTPESESSPTHERKEQVTEAGIVGCRGYDPKKFEWYNHMTAAEIRKKIDDEKWNSYYKFCSVRNPFDKCVSMYNHVRSSSQYGYLNGIVRGKVASMSKYMLKVDFERFIKTFKSDRDRYVVDGKVCMDGITFFENIQEDTKKVNKKLEVSKSVESMPRAKTSNRINSYDTRQYYTENSKRYVEEEFRFEIEKFGYAFPGPGERSEPSESSREELGPSVEMPS